MGDSRDIQDRGAPPPPIPITIVTGFLGSGKTTLILNLVSQLRAQNPSYRLALLKNEFGDLAIDSQLASSAAISSVRELLNGCICCNLVGQLGPALAALRDSSYSSSPSPDSTSTASPSSTSPPSSSSTTPTSFSSSSTPLSSSALGPPNRIVIETSGSAFPATLALEVNRLARDTGAYVLDGVVSVVDVENWAGYEDTSYTAKIQARYTDLVVLNKWERVDDDRYEEVLDRLGDLDVDVARVRSDNGWVAADIVFGVDGGLAAALLGDADLQASTNNGTAHTGQDQKRQQQQHHHSHQSEVEVLSAQLGDGSQDDLIPISTDKFLAFLSTTPKDEVYRIKAIVTLDKTPRNSDPDVPSPADHPTGRYILNWAFGRWTFTPMLAGGQAGGEHASSSGVALRLTMVLGRYESNKWKKKLEAGGLIEPAMGFAGDLVVKRLL